MSQSFSNHARYFPPFHFFATPVLMVYFVYTIRVASEVRTWPTVLAAVVAFALIVLAVSARTMALTVQNRVIRLEEQLRMQRLLPADLQARIGELSVGQLVALRFASDAELPELTRTVLTQGITDKKAIKRMITTWRPDHLRA
ncbi:MAG: hypothetical protein KA267_09765 [Gemmatimonadales bacterium]|nr:hypothetical protein [Gemmatimonadales bacterium]MBP6571935.1 hypothetical protein [Gemmatimonadales bacterium]